MLPRDQRNSLWKSLLPGDVITILDAGTVVCSGYIEDRTENGTVIWIMEKIGGRRLFHIDDEYDFEVSAKRHDEKFRTA
jgi:hypothetical protein